jgi:hypothetical protein
VDYQEAIATIRTLHPRVDVIIRGASDAALRHRPAPGEWSAIEVIGHLVDKLTIWTERVRRVADEERPELPGFDQDAHVASANYQEAKLRPLLGDLAMACDRFAATAQFLPASKLSRVGVHGELGELPLPQWVVIPAESTTEHLEQMRAAMRSYWKANGV